MTQVRRPINFRGVRCPFPGCDHLGDFITKAHCELNHGMGRDELFSKYGEPTTVVFDSHARKMNLKISEANNIRGYFDGYG